MRIIHTLSFRVFVGTVPLLLLLFGGYSYLTIRFYKEQMMNQVFVSANRVSDLIKASTHYSMLLNRKQDVYNIITVVGKEPEVEGLRIYNKRGKISYSTDSLENGQMVDLRAEACIACHDREKPLTSLPMSNRMRVYNGPDGHRQLGLINPIKNEPSCSRTGCHRDQMERTVLGVLDVRMSLERVDQAINESGQKMTWYAVIMIVTVAFASALFLFFEVRRPVKRLIQGTHQVSSGNLDHEIDVRSKDELGLLASSFNAMTRSLKRAQTENEDWAQTLEDRVKKKTDELKRINEQIIHVEKMASLGKLAATVAHELNNPLAGVLTYAKLLKRKIGVGTMDEATAAEIQDELSMIADETARCGNIVKNLLLFSRQKVGERIEQDLRDVIGRTLKLIDHHLKMHNISLETSIAEEALLLRCDPEQIEQALLAIEINAVEAMPDSGTLRVIAALNREAGKVTIAIADTGVGIPADALPQIFEPFFTTKEHGKGTGLGLAVAYGIIERHHGTISVDSQLHVGTTFTLSFPQRANIEHTI
ncbi:MAG: ATP-binding protein [Ignavibacteriales bacterium]|nr:ATP-binding protein [Ignavibacteriales bacterium]